MKTTGLFTN